MSHLVPFNGRLGDFGLPELGQAQLVGPEILSGRENFTVVLLEGMIVVFSMWNREALTHAVA